MDNLWITQGRGVFLCGKSALLTIYCRFTTIVEIVDNWQKIVDNSVDNSFGSPFQDIFVDVVSEISCRIFD